MVSPTSTRGSANGKFTANHDGDVMENYNKYINNNEAREANDGENDCDTNLDHSVFIELLKSEIRMQQKDDDNDYSSVLPDHVVNHNKTIITSSLSCRNIASRHLDDILLTSSPTERMIKSLRCRLRAQMPDTEYIIASLLTALPTAYDTPWQLIYEGIGFIIEQDQGQPKEMDSSRTEGINTEKGKHRRNVVLDEHLIRCFVSCAQHFLREIVAVWLDEERKCRQQLQEQQQEQKNTKSFVRTPRKAITEKTEVLTKRTSRDWIIRLIKELMKLFHVTKEVMDPNESDKLMSNKQTNRSIKRTLTETYSPAGDDDSFLYSSLLGIDEQVEDNNNFFHIRDGVTETIASPAARKWSPSLMDIITTIITLSCHLDKSLLDACLDIVFGNSTSNERINPKKLVSWIKLAITSQDIIRQKDWDYIHNILQAYIVTISQHHTRGKKLHYLLSPNTDLPILAECLLSLSESSFVGQSNPLRPLSCSRLYKSAVEPAAFRWHKLILELLVSVTHDNNHNDAACIYSNIEFALQSRLSAIPFLSFQRWSNGLVMIVQSILETYKTEETRLHHNDDNRSDDVNTLSPTTLNHQRPIIPKWITINMLLLVNRSSSQSGSSVASLLVHRALTGQTESSSDPDYDLTSECWKLLGKIIRSSVSKTFTYVDRISGARLSDSKKRKASSSSTKTTTITTTTTTNISKGFHEHIIPQLFENVVYVGNGRFENPERNPVDILTEMGSHMFHCLFLNVGLGSNDLSYSRQYAVERAKCLCDYSWYVLKSKFATGDATDTILALVCMTVVYFEMPSLRAQIVGDMKNVITRDTSMGRNMITSTSSFCCTILSVLIRSMQYLGGLADNFSELEQVAEVFATPAPLAVFVHLAKALSPLLSVRRVLLRIAHEQLSAPNMAELWCMNKFTQLQCRFALFDPVKCGLAALLVLISSPSSWSAYEVQAWVKLSSFLVDGNSYVPLSTRSWLYREVAMYAQKDAFDDSTVQHLLRACLVRMLQFVGSDKNGSNRFTYERVFISVGTGVSKNSCLNEIEDVAGLFEVIFSLIYVRTLNNKENASLFASCIGILKKLILRKQALDEDNDDTMLLSLESLSDQINCDKLVLVASFHCLALALVENDCLKYADWEMQSLTTLKLLFVSQELNEVRHRLQENDIPNWLKTPESKMSSGETCSQSQVGRIQLDLLDLLFDLLWGKRLPLHYKSDVENFGGNVGSSLKLCSLLDKKRELLDSCIRRHEKDIYENRTSRKQVAVFHMLLQVFIPDIKQHIADHSGFDQVKEFVTKCLVLCETVRKFQQEVDDVSVAENIRALWSLYMCLCTENAAVAFISYLESQSSNLEDPVFCGFSVSKPQGVDCAIRYCRLVIIRCLSANLSSASESKHSSSNELCKEQTNREPLCGLFLEMVDTLCSDLRKGLQGDSGGLTYEVFWSFVTCIESCTAFMQLQLKSISDEYQLKAALEICENAEKMFEDILCSFDISQPGLLKKTMMLGIETFSFMRKSICCQLCILGLFDLARKGYLSCRSQSQMFYQVAEILRHRTELSSCSSLNWHDIVDSGHINDGEEGNDCQHKSHVCNVAQDSLPRNHGSSLNEKKLRLCREACWTVAVCCLLQTFEKIWRKSHILMPEDVSTTRSALIFDFYFSLRKEELTDTLRSICRVFRQIDSLPRQESETSEVSVHATCLPAAAKTCLLSLVDRVLIVLHAAVKMIITSLEDSLKSTSTSSRSDFLELISCFLAWMSLQSNDLEFTFVVQKWLAAEKFLKTNSIKSERGYVPQPIFISRLPKTDYRLEELELGMEKLVQVLEKNVSLPKQTAVLSKIDKLIEGPGHMSGLAGTRFLYFVREKLKFIKEKRRMLYDELDLTDKNRQKNRVVSNSVTYPARKQRRPRALRSRNGVVDRWLQLDHEKGHDEIITNDTFVDLEDFIIDG